MSELKWVENKKFAEWFEAQKIPDAEDSDWYPVIRYWCWKAWEKQVEITNKKPITEKWLRDRMWIEDVTCVNTLVELINAHFLGGKDETNNG